MEVIAAAAELEGALVSRAARERVERVARRMRGKGSCIAVFYRRYYPLGIMAAGLMLDGGVEGKNWFNLGLWNAVMHAEINLSRSLLRCCLARSG